MVRKGFLFAFLGASMALAPDLAAQSGAGSPAQQQGHGEGQPMACPMHAQHHGNHAGMQGGAHPAGGAASGAGHAGHAGHAEHAGHGAGMAHGGHPHGAMHSAACVASAGDSAFAALQARGKVAMGVDQYTSTHVFDSLEDGGRIELQRNVDDPEGIRTIREHLQEIARAFKAGDFSTPAFVHMMEVPGTRIMAAKRDAITYTFRELPRGGELRITTRDPEAIRAIHEFMAFQREDHRAGGVTGHH
jgi:hypothetical protein